MDWQAQVGKNIVFEDGKILRLVQLKPREGGLMAIFEVIDPPGIPRRFYYSLNEFAQQFQQLYEARQ